MGARPSSFKKGGGFLNGVDGVITDYQFTDEFNGVPFKAGRDPKTKKEKFHSLYCVLHVRVDGADEDVTTTLFVGGADDWEVSEDGHEITPTEDGRELGAGTSFATLLSSLIDAGFPEGNLPEDAFNFSAIIGTRARFVQRRNEEATKKLGKRVSKDGKQFDRTDLIIETVYDLPSAEGKTNGKAAKPAAAKTAKGKATPVEEEVDLEAVAKETLVTILSEASGNKIVKNKLSMEVLKKLMKHPQREDVRNLILSDEFLGQEDGWSFDKKKSLVEAAE